MLFCKQTRKTELPPTPKIKWNSGPIPTKTVFIKMNEPFNSTAPEPRKVGVWTEGAPPVETREYVMPKKSPDSIDDIPTIPDLDDLQELLEKEISKPPVSDQQDSETVNTLAEVGGVSGSVEGVEAALEVLLSHVPPVESDTADTVWTVDSLLIQLAEEQAS